MGYDCFNCDRAYEPLSNPMKLITAYTIIKHLPTPVFRTEDIAIILKISNKYSNKILTQLCTEKLMLHLKRGLWALKEKVEPFMLPSYLTTPLPSYISVQSALYYHGMISQIPSVIYAVSIARTRKYTTAIGVYSVHHIDANLFSGFYTIGNNNELQMATQEKALFDFFYLKAAKNRFFYALPEVEIPENFSWQTIESYTQQIQNKSRKSMVLNEIKKYWKGNPLAARN